MGGVTNPECLFLNRNLLLGKLVQSRLMIERLFNRSYDRKNRTYDIKDSTYHVLMKGVEFPMKAKPITHFFGGSYVYQHVSKNT